MAQLQGPAVNPALRLRANVEESLGVFRGWCQHGRLWAAVGRGPGRPLISCCSPQVGAAGVGQEPLTAGSPP